MEKPGFLIQRFMIAGLLAAIGMVVLAGQPTRATAIVRITRKIPIALKRFMARVALRTLRAMMTGNLKTAISNFSHLPHVRGPSRSSHAKALARRCGNTAIARCAPWIAVV